MLAAFAAGASCLEEKTAAPVRLNPSEASAVAAGFHSRQWSPQHHIRVGDGPRVVGGQGRFPWPPETGVSPAASEARLLDRVLRDVVR